MIKIKIQYIFLFNLLSLFFFSCLHMSSNEFDYTIDRTCFGEIPYINEHFHNAVTMEYNLSCRDCGNCIGKNNCIECNNVNLDLIDRFYHKAMEENNLSKEDLKEIYAYYSDFLLKCKNKPIEAKKYSQMSLNIDQNFKFALFTDLMCDCSMAVEKNEYMDIIQHIEKLEKDGSPTPYMYICLLNAYINTGEICKAEGVLKSNKLNDYDPKIKIYFRIIINKEKSKKGIITCSD